MGSTMMVAADENETRPRQRPDEDASSEQPSSISAAVTSFLALVVLSAVGLSCTLTFSLSICAGAVAVFRKENLGKWLPPIREAPCPSLWTLTPPTEAGGNLSDDCALCTDPSSPTRPRIEVSNRSSGSAVVKNSEQGTEEKQTYQQLCESIWASLNKETPQAAADFAAASRAPKVEMATVAAVDCWQGKPARSTAGVWLAQYAEGTATRTYSPISSVSTQGSGCPPEAIEVVVVEQEDSARPTTHQSTTVKASSPSPYDFTGSVASAKWGDAFKRAVQSSPSTGWGLAKHMPGQQTLQERAKELWNSFSLRAH